MLKRVLTTAAALAALFLASHAEPSLGQEKKGADEKEKASIWMQAKLDLSQQILSGLTRGDLDRVAKAAESLNILNYLERWERAGIPAYKQQLSFFQLASTEVVRQAREKNTDGATLAYNQLTISCIQCHKIVRDNRR
jgi:hypothetical protein